MWKNKILPAAIILLVLSIVTALVFFAVGSILNKKSSMEANSFSVEDYSVSKPEIEKDFLSPNPFSRPQDKLKAVKGIVVHYTANPKTTAKNNRDYFEGLKNKKGNPEKTYASSHFIIGLEGEIIQCIPLSEISYASNDRNDDTVSIECCHPDRTGEFRKQTYDSLIGLLAWLCTKYDLQKEDIIRHYDVTGKECPKYYVEHEEAWEQLKKAVEEYIREHDENTGRP